MTFSYSTDEERFFGDYATRQEAESAGLAEAIEENRVEFLIGENRPPSPQPEEVWDTSEWLEQVSCCEEYSCEWADGWERSTKEQRQELDEEVQAVIGRWLDRHDLRPKFFNVVNVVRVAVPPASKNGVFCEE